MRSVLTGAIAVGALVVAPSASPARAGAIASHCTMNQSVDLCYGVGQSWTKGRYRLYFYLSMGDEYFSRWRLCVHPVGLRKTCRTFPVRQMGIYSPRWGGSILWRRYYSMPRPHAYEVTVYQGSARPLGPRLTFQLPA